MLSHITVRIVSYITLRIVTFIVISWFLDFTIPYGNTLDFSALHILHFPTAHDFTFGPIPIGVQTIRSAPTDVQSIAFV